VPCIDPRYKRGGLAASVLLAACSSPLPPDAPVGSVAAARTPSAAALAIPSAVHSMKDVRLQAAHRLVAANPGATYSGTVPDMLLAIPVLEVELNADGSIRRIEVLRRPTQAHDTVQLAIDAMRRAAPFGNVSRLPKPWKFSETFLFTDDRKFKPRTLDN
jgi:hypothetical protein